MSRYGARSSCEIVRHPLPCNQLIHGCEQTPGADFATHTARARASLHLPGNNGALCPPARRSPWREPHPAQSSRSASRGLTSTAGARSQLPAAGAGPPAARHRCPPRNCAGAPREPPPPESTPSVEAARWTAWGAHKHQCQQVERSREQGVRVCARACTCENINMYREKGARIKTDWESKPAQQFSNRSKSRCLILSPEQHYWESEIYEPCSSMGHCEVRAPDWQVLLPSFTYCNPKKRTGAWHRTRSCSVWRAGLGSLCNRDRRSDLGRDRGCPNTEVPRIERECPRKSPASPADAMGTLCSQCWKWGVLQPVWRLAVSEVRNLHPDCLVPLLALSNCYTFRYQLFCQRTNKSAPKVNAGILGHTLTKSGHYQRHGPSLHNTWTAPCASKSCPSWRWSMQHNSSLHLC